VTPTDGTTQGRLTNQSVHAEIVLMIRAITDDRIRRVWAILIGMSVFAVTVVIVTAMINDRVQ